MKVQLVRMKLNGRFHCQQKKKKKYRNSLCVMPNMMINVDVKKKFKYK